MKRNAIYIIVGFIFLMFLPGCRLVDWGKSSVNQGIDLDQNIELARNYVRSSRVYDQFTLLGAFDSLWLADVVRETYADLYAVKHGKSEEEKKVFLRRQLEENNHFISFYLLSIADVVIGEKDSIWTIFLKIGDNNFMPTEFKTVELSPEYKRIFGKKFTRFKVAYILRFNAKDIEDISLIQPDIKKISLVFRTVNKEVEHTWDIDEKGQLIL